MKSNLTNWLIALCALMSTIALGLLIKQQRQFDALQRQHDAVLATLNLQQQQQLSAAAQLGNQVTNLGVSLQQQTSVVHRALGKVIPVELPESLIKKLGAMEARILDENSWPKDAAESDAMLGELRDLVRQIPPWAEEDLLPRLNALRWGVQSLLVLRGNANVAGEELATAAEAFANQITIQPDIGSTNIAGLLATRQADATQRFTVYRRETAIKDAKDQLALAVTSDALAAWQRLSEWTNSPTHAQQVLELRQQLRARLLKDEVAKFTEATKASLQRFDALTTVALRQAGYFRTMEHVTVQRLQLLEEPDIPPSAGKELADLSASVEARIKAEMEKQRREDTENIRGYQQWALEKIAAFRKDFGGAQQQEKPGRVFGTNTYTDYAMIRNAMVNHLLPVSPAHLDSAVAKIYSQAFEDGWNKLGGTDEKYLQTQVAQRDAVTPKRMPQNYKEQP